MAQDTIKHPYAPKYWPIWLGLGSMWLISQIPYRVQMGLGWSLGRLMSLFPRRRFIACVNLELAFPEKSAQERNKLLKKHFVSVGRGMLETASCWFGTNRFIERHVEIRGLEHVEAAIAEGKGVILFGAHFTSMEICGRGFGQHMPFYSVYKPNRNPLFEQIMSSRRNRIYGGSIPNTDMRQMIKKLRNGELVWYAADQNYGLKNSLFAPFFGVPVATTTGTTRIVKMTGAAIIPAFTLRKPDASGNFLEFLPAIEDFPGDDVLDDVTRLNSLIESKVREYPDQYLWIHRRFKDHPEGGKNRYERYVEESERH
jgi:KDO2-lipid IV(A) lauroyltransferase